MMTFVCMLVGCIAGAWLSFAVFDESIGMIGAFFGLAVGWLLGRQIKLTHRVVDLEARLQTLLSERSTAATAQNSAAQVASGGIAPQSPTQTVTATSTGSGNTLLDERGAVVESAFADAYVPANPLASTLSEPPNAVATPTTDTHAATATSAPKPPLVPRPIMPPPPPLRESALLIWAKRWFTEGNVPVKIGVIVLFFGVAYLFKYAADQGWLTLPIELRFVGVAIAALAALVFAWRKRESHRAFALSLQGGAIGVLILTVFAAYKLYGLVPATFAFALLIVVVAGAGALAVLQDSLALALLAIVGGFLAPILISTGSGNHVALFSYYAILNTAIFVIAWIKPWRALNLVGFAFTFGIGTFWGSLSYRPELFASTEPFLLLFFAFYLLLPLLYALRLAPDKRDFVDGSLVFGTPLVAFALQAALLHGDRMQLAFSAIGAAAIYMLLATIELRRWRLTLLGESHALLALGFATLAVPLALSARATACTFALEGAALIWFGLRQQRRVPRWIGYALQGLAGCAFVFGYGGRIDSTPILNGEFFGALILALAGLVSARLLTRNSVRAPLAMAFFTWGTLWWYFTGCNEIARHASSALQWDWWLGFFAVSALIAVELWRRLDWRECLIPAAATILIGLPFIGLTMLSGHGPFEGWAMAAWALWVLAAWRTLPALIADRVDAGRTMHMVYLWIMVLLAGAELAHLADTHAQLSRVWIGLAALAPVALMFVLALRRLQPARWPIGANAETLRSVFLTSLTVLLGIGGVRGLIDEGNPAPLPYIPVINPIELAMIGFLVLLALWYRQAEREGSALMSVELRARALALAGLALLTSVTLRSVHFLGGVSWDESLTVSPLAQAALSIVWTLAGIAAMLIGKKRGSRAVWFGGAALMAAVLVKLLLIDRQYLHDLPAIIGVLVVGLLLVAVGYFAPVPPKTVVAGDET
jgi:uncharacterized membrane protein